MKSRKRCQRKRSDWWALICNSAISSLINICNVHRYDFHKISCYREKDNKEDKNKTQMLPKYRRPRQCQSKIEREKKKQLKEKTGQYCQMKTERKRDLFEDKSKTGDQRGQNDKY